MSITRARVVAALGALTLSAVVVSAQGPATDFKPDTTFSGSTLAGWHVLGDADWKAQNGELIGTAKPGTSGGWLVLDKKYEDVYFFSRFQCTGECKTGLLFRMVDTPDGGKTGVFVSLAPNDLNQYRVTFDAQGKEKSRERLANATAFTRFAPAGGGRGGGAGAAPPAGAPAGRGGAGAAAPAAGAPPAADGAAAGGRGGRGGAGAPPAGAAPAADAAGGRGGRGGGGGGGAAAGATGCTGNGAGRAGSPKTLPVPLPDLEPPALGIRTGQWNSITVSVDADVIRPWLNGGLDFCGAVTDDRDAFGPVALWAGGLGEVRFKDVSFKDLHVRTLVKEVVSPNFTMQRIDDYYTSWGAAAADFNRDGVMDVAAGPFVYYGPDFTQRREMYPQLPFAPGGAFSSTMVDWAYDFTGDGWPDVLAGESRAMHLYVNPKGENRHWQHLFVLPQITSEAAVMADLDGDGRPEAVFGQGGAGNMSTIAFASYDPSNPAGVSGNPSCPTSTCWPSHLVSEPGLGFGHSMGVGDVNGDGKKDILQTAGWWEQPAAGIRSGLWKYHPVAFGRWGKSESAGGAELMVYDVNGDKLNDVVTGLNAHGFGLAWFQQKRAANGDISFERHMIMDDFSTKNAGNVTISEMHASNMGDMNGDGIPDYVTGKRVFSHQESYVDPDPLGPGVVYVFRTVRDPKAPGGAVFVPELVHNRSGVGSQFTVADLNKDGVQDIVTSTNRGTFIFWGKKRAAAAR